MADDVDPGLEDALADQREVRLEDASLELRIGEPRSLAIHGTHAALEELPGDVVADLLPVEGDAVDRPDDVIERVPRRARERRSNAEVVLDADAQAEPRGIVHVAAERVVVLELVPGVMVAHPVRPYRDALRPILERDAAVGS